MNSAAQPEDLDLQVLIVFLSRVAAMPRVALVAEAPRCSTISVVPVVCWLLRQIERKHSPTNTMIIADRVPSSEATFSGACVL